MTSIELEPANAGDTPDYDPGPVAVEVAPKRVKRTPRLRRRSQI